MHKSVSILSIFLIASSFMTLGNIFPKAMAIELDGVYFETDETREYVNNMAAYVEDKYQPYANGYDSYEKSQNSDFVKEMKCNSINSNLNGLNVNTLPGSTTAEDIGTKALQGGDKEANTFGSASRNNYGNFDVDCINNNNKQGGHGLAGPFSHAAMTERTTSQQSNNALTSQSNNVITNPTTTQSSNVLGVPQSSNIVPITFSSAPSSTLVNILPGNSN